MKNYESLLKIYKTQPLNQVFAHFHSNKRFPDGSIDYDEPFRNISRQTVDGPTAWEFHQPRFKEKYNQVAPKLRNYLNYTFMRLLTLDRLRMENGSPEKYFLFSEDDQWVCFNTGLLNKNGTDLVLVFERNPLAVHDKVTPDWMYRACYPVNHDNYRYHFGMRVPHLAHYAEDSRDFVFDLHYSLDKDSFDHLFERAKERSGFADASDEVVRNYLRGAIENLIPKIARNYKTAIPVYYVEEERMQLLLPFVSANGEDLSCFLVQRDDDMQNYTLKTILDLDQAYFGARLITRPDKDWLNP